MRIIVTGGNSGIGRATAAALAVAGHSVLIAGRDIPKAERAAAEMAGDVEVAHLDLADLTSVRKFADSVETVDVLVNNAVCWVCHSPVPQMASRRSWARTTSAISPLRACSATGSGTGLSR
jgi:NAD(P)-dependent dehydrogenase (short-subunit alcohol dehydrogenase family)